MGATTFNITIFSITSLSMMGFFGPLSIMKFTIIKTLRPTGLFATLRITLSSAVVQ